MRSAALVRTSLWLLVLLAILLPAALIRMVGLDHNPPGFWQDEASTGFDAYLLWTTGRDRAGKLFPVAAASFGDYPLALYRYLTAPVVGLFGRTPGTERFVAALGGWLLIASTGLFALRTLGPLTALAAMLSAAFTPMWIHFSRYGSEAILLPLCLTSGAALIELGRHPRRRGLLWLGVVALAASAYTYHAVKLVLPLWTAAYLVYLGPFLKRLYRKERRHVIGPSLLFAVLVLPSVLTALTPEGMARGRVVMAWHHYKGWDLPMKVLAQWLGYFDLNVLFLRGGPHLSQSMPGVGVFNLIDLPLLAIGFVLAARGIAPRFSSGDGREDHDPVAEAVTAPPSPLRVYGFLAFWFLLGPLPGGMTYETQNIGRAIAWLPVPQIFSGVGLAGFLAWAGRILGGRGGAPQKFLLVVLVLGLGAAWLQTGRMLFVKTWVEYPRLAEREFQFEISAALQCARGLLRDERLVVSPNLVAAEVAETFVGYYFGDRLRAHGPDRSWEHAQRQEVKPGELYVTNAGTAVRGLKLCETRTRSGRVVAEVFVQRAPPPLRPGPVVPFKADASPPWQP